MFDPEPTNAVRSHLEPDELAAGLAEPVPCGPDGYRHDGVIRLAWTPNGFLRRGDRFVLVCQHPDCRRRKSDAPLQRLVDRGQGDHPMHTFKWRCAEGADHEVTVEIVQAGRIY